MAWVYLRKCSDGSYYCGSTTDLDAGVWQQALIDSRVEELPRLSSPAPRLCKRAGLMQQATDRRFRDVA